MSKSSFLPFIKSSSSEDAIFKAIIQRTKGSPNSALINLFSVVLVIGVEEIRTRIEKMDKNLPTSVKVSEIVAQGTEHHIPNSERKFWEYVSKHYKPNRPSNFTTEELAVFLTVLAVHKPESLQSSEFDIGTEKLKKLLEYSKETCKPGIDDVPGVTITEDSIFRTGFTCWEEFKAYLATKFDTEGNTDVCPVYIKTDSRVVTDHIYSENHCESPYRGKNNET